MRILGIGEPATWVLYLRLLHEGHELRVSVGEKLTSGTMAGWCRVRQLARRVVIYSGEQAANLIHIVRLAGDKLDSYRVSGGLNLRYKRS